MPVNDPNSFIPPGVLDATLRPFALALSRWLKGKFDGFKSGTNTATFDASGYHTFYFPKAFPTACTSAVAMVNMPTSSEQIINIDTRTREYIRLRKAAATATSVTFCWMAWGN